MIEAPGRIRLSIILFWIKLENTLDLKVMRYLTMRKFEWMLRDGGIYLAPASLQSDRSEGLYSAEGVVGLLKLSENKKPLIRFIKKFMKFGQGDTFLSSWYIGQEESQSMWDMYGKDGVIILSSKYLLEDHLPRPLNLATEVVSAVYSDKKKALNYINPLHTKSRKFVNEKELRLVFNLTRYKVQTGYESDYLESSELANSLELGAVSRDVLELRETALSRKGVGFVFNFELAKLISGVVVHPGASDKFLADVEKLCKDSGLTCAVKRSSLNAKN